MAKDPAFLFYTNDFLSGIQDLTFEERGQYITLLCLQHQKGHLSDKLINLSVGNAAVDVMAKFRQDSAGLWFNARLDLEIEKRRAHGEKQKERAIEGWKKRKGEAKPSQTVSPGNAAALPLEDVNENVIEDKNNNKKEYDFSKPDIGGDEVVFPIDTKATRDLWAKWKEYRWKEHGQRYGMMGEQADLKRLANMTYAQMEGTILTAMANKWKNLYPENKRNGKSTKTEQSNATSDYLKQYYSDKAKQQSV